MILVTIDKATGDIHDFYDDDLMASQIDSMAGHLNIPPVVARRILEEQGILRGMFRVLVNRSTIGGRQYLGELPQAATEEF